MMKSGERGIVNMLWTVALVAYLRSDMSMGEVLYSHPQAIDPTRGSVLTYIDIGETMHVEMDIVPHAWGGCYPQIFHCGSNDNIQVPGVWLCNNDFHIGWSGIEGGANIGANMQLEETYNLQLDVDQGALTVKVNGEVKLEKTGTAPTYNDMVCYVSDPWRNAADVTVANLLITDGATNDPTKDPTRDPSADPTPEPTLEPTKDCSFLHIDQFLVDCSSEFDDHGARIQRLESNGNALETKMEEVMKHLNVLKDHGVQSGVTPVGPMPLGMGDYALYALAATNVLLVLCLTIYCVFVRTAPKYGKVAMYETEA